MNTIGEHLDLAEHQLGLVAASLSDQSRITAARAKGLLSETNTTVLCLRDLLSTTWGPASTTLKTINGTDSGTHRDELVAMATSLDRRGNPPALRSNDVTVSGDCRLVASARQNVQQAEAIIHAHVRDDRRDRSIEAARIADTGSRWTLTERVAAVATATARIETQVLDLWTNPSVSPARRAGAQALLVAARRVATGSQGGDPYVLGLHEAGHGSLQRHALSHVAAPLKRLCQQVFARDTAGDLDGISVRTATTVGVLVSGHLEVIARSAQHRAPELWTGVLGEIREQELRRVAADALNARQAWQQVHAELRLLQPVGRPDLQLTRQATTVRTALEAITRDGDQWRPAHDIIRSRNDVADLLAGTAKVAPDLEGLASMLDRGLSRARSADLCIRADKIPEPETYVAERLARKWVPAPREVLDSVRAAARTAEVRSRSVGVSAAEVSIALADPSPERALALAAQVTAQAPHPPDCVRQRRAGPRQL